MTIKNLEGDLFMKKFKKAAAALLCACLLATSAACSPGEQSSSLPAPVQMKPAVLNPAMRKLR